MADEFPVPLESSTEFLAIKDLVEKASKQKKINLNPVYQRDVVWSESKMSAFIDSLMRGYIPSNITMNIESEKDTWTCIDGKQRIMSIINFVKNAIPWLKEDIEEGDEFVFYNNVPDGRKDNKNCSALTKVQRSEFLEKTLIVVSYKNLDYNQQCDIFNRIQNSMSATSGEQTLSLFKNQEVASKFKQFCRDHDYTGKARFRNVEILMNAMYMKKNNDPKILSGKREKRKFIAELDDMNEYNRLVKLTEKHLTVFFGDELMGHKDVLSKKMTKNYIMMMFYMLTLEQAKPDNWTEEQIPKVRRMVIRIWDLWNIIDGDINKELSKTSGKVLEKIKKLYEDNSAIMGNLDADDNEDSDSDDVDNVDDAENKEDSEDIDNDGVENKEDSEDIDNNDAEDNEDIDYKPINNKQSMSKSQSTVSNKTKMSGVNVNTSHTKSKTVIRRAK